MDKDLTRITTSFGYLINAWQNDWWSKPWFWAVTNLSWQSFISWTLEVRTAYDTINTYPSFVFANYCKYNNSYCLTEIYETLKNIYGYCDTFNSIVEADGKYEKISFKGCKDKSFFIDKLGRLPRHHILCIKHFSFGSIHIGR